MKNWGRIGKRGRLWKYWRRLQHVPCLDSRWQFKWVAARCYPCEILSSAHWDDTKTLHYNLLKVYKPVTTIGKGVFCCNYPWTFKVFIKHENSEIIWQFLRFSEFLKKPRKSWRVQEVLIWCLLVFRVICFLEKIRLEPHSMHIFSFCCWKAPAPMRRICSPCCWARGPNVAPAGQMAPNVAATAGQEFPLLSCGPTVFPSIFQTL